MRIGRKIWQNECGGTVAGLTSWNTGENFASLGIGHFIWYPAGAHGPFEESFPPLVRYVHKARREAARACCSGGTMAPAHGTRARNFSPLPRARKMKELRIFLVDTIDLQADFLVERLQRGVAEDARCRTGRERAGRSRDNSTVSPPARRVATR